MYGLPTKQTKTKWSDKKQNLILQTNFPAQTLLVTHIRQPQRKLQSFNISLRQQLIRARNALKK